MDDAVAGLERARAADPDDVGVVVELARACVRIGRPLRALAVLGPLDPGERDAAGRALAAALGVEWGGVVDGTDRFFARDPQTPFVGRDLVLVHAGAFLDDGEAGLVSSLSERIGRADVKRVVVPAFLAALEPEGAPDPAALQVVVAAAGGRLPTAQEWKKLWRGGVFLDGDESQRVENPAPDRLVPQLESPGFGQPGFGDSAAPRVRSAYGARFVPHAGEVLRGSAQAGILGDPTGRHFVSIETPAQRRRRRLVARVVRELPRDP